MKHARAIGLVLIVVSCGVGLFVKWGVESRQRSILLSGIPPTPDLSGWAPELGLRITDCEDRARNDSRAIEALGALSRLYHGNGFLNEANQCYGSLEVLDASNPRWFYRHATILAGFGDAEQAQWRFSRVIHLAPAYSAARLRQAELHIKTNDFPAARRDYDAILRDFPDEPYALLGQARCEIQDGNWTIARPLLERLVTQTSYRLGYDLLVTVYEKLGMAESAGRIRAMYRASGAFRDFADPWMLELDDDCYSAYQNALASGAAERAGNFVLAARRIERAITLSPDEGTLYFQYGALLLRMKKYTSAREQFEICTRVSPGLSDGWAFLSSLQETLGEHDGARRTLNTGLLRCPESAGLHLQLARVLIREGFDDQAIEEFRRAILLRPNEADAFLGLATTLFGKGRIDEALDAVDGALAAEPEQPAALSMRAFHAIASGNRMEAERWLDRLMAQPRTEVRDRERLRQEYRLQFGADYQSD